MNISCISLDPAIPTTATSLSEGVSYSSKVMAVSTGPTDVNNKQPLVMVAEPTASSGKPGGFGSISCVICGGKDHATYCCLQREKRFVHM